MTSLTDHVLAGDHGRAGASAGYGHAILRSVGAEMHSILNAAKIKIRAVRPTDAAVWEAMRRELWPDGAADHGPEIALFFAGHRFKDLSAVVVAENQAGEILGFAELSSRDDVPGLEGTRTGYIEGLYVPPEVRLCGVAEKLLRASRTWAREQGCAAFASDRAERVIVDRSFARMKTEDE